VTTADVARILGVTPAAVRRAALRRGCGTPPSPGARDWTFSAEDVERLRVPMPRGKKVRS
jgi:hypothetical protein